MANIKKDEIKFLKNLCAGLYLNNFTKDADSLKSLIDSLEDRDAKRNERTKEFVFEKRKSDPYYGRSKEERDRIERRNKDA